MRVWAAVAERSRTDVERIREAAQARAPLRAAVPETTAYRVVNGEADGLSGVTVDWFDGVAVVSLYHSLQPAEEDALVEAVGAALRPRSVYLKRRPREARVVATTQRAAVAPETPAFGEAVSELPVKEGGLAYWIRPGQGLSVGLYLDMRDTRRWVREHARDRTVLNCFAYTCAFAVAARAGGATRVVNVDLSRKVLDWGRQNAQLNGQPAPPADYLAGDVFEWLRRLARRGERMDLVILDPPSFATSKRGAFSAATDYPRLAEAAAGVVGQGGILLACCNLATLTTERFEEAVALGLGRVGRRARRVGRLGASPVDFPTPPGARSPLKVVALELE